jgi:hypothetical protein
VVKRKKGSKKERSTKRDRESEFLGGHRWSQNTKKKYQKKIHLHIVDVDYHPITTKLLKLRLAKKDKKVNHFEVKFWAPGSTKL